MKIGQVLLLIFNSGLFKLKYSLGLGFFLLEPSTDKVVGSNY